MPSDWHPDDEDYGAGGNGGGHRRRRADRPSRLDKTVQRGVEKTSCALTLLTIGLYAVAATLLHRRR